MEAIVRTCAHEAWGARIAAVIANRPDAAGLAFAASHGIDTAVVDHRLFGHRAHRRRAPRFARQYVVPSASWLQHQ